MTNRGFLDARNELRVSGNTMIPASTTLQSNKTLAMATTYGSLVFVDTTNEASTVNLGDARTQKGRVITIKDVGGTLSSNLLALTTGDTSSIDNNVANMTTITSNYTSVTIASDGTQWWTLSSTVSDLVV